MKYCVPDGLGNNEPVPDATFTVVAELVNALERVVLALLANIKTDILTL